MRIYLTNVEENRNKDYIMAETKKIFPNYSVVVIPSKYATKDRKEETLLYEELYCFMQRVEEADNQQRHQIERINKAMQSGIENSIKDFTKSINHVSQSITEFYQNNEPSSISKKDFEIKMFDVLNNYVNDKKVIDLIIKNLYNNIKNSKFDNLSKREMDIEVTKIIIKSVKQIDKGKEL